MFFYSNRASDPLRPLVIEMTGITPSAEGYAHFRIFLFLQRNLYSILLDTGMLCDPPVTSLSKDFKRANEPTSPSLLKPPSSKQRYGVWAWGTH